MSEPGTTHRPVPTPDRDSRPWWEALARHELALQRCDACAAWRWPARAICGRCASFDATWTPVTGRATVASWIVNHHTFSAAFESPYAVVTVRLDEQPDLLLVGSWSAPIDDLAIGAPVEVVFDDVVPGAADGGSGTEDEGHGAVTLLSWRPAATA